MKRQNEWIYRNLYNRHYLMSITTNEILCISEAIAELFIAANDEKKTFQEIYVDWCEAHNLNYYNDVSSFLIKKGVLYAEI